LLDPHLPLFFASLALAAMATGAAACDGLAEGPAGTVAAVRDGNTLVLDSGIAVRLIGTLAPLPAGRHAPAEPLAEAARAALAGLVLHRPVHLGLDEEETDRYGRMEAQVFLDDPEDTWVEQALLARGMARLAPEGPNLRCLAELLPAEAEARAAGLGIWADPYYSVRDAGDPATLMGRAGRYELIEGEVVTTGEVRGRLYLDFGRVWKNDVTATIEGKARALFTTAGIDPLALKGKRVRIRGWLTSRDGPVVALGSPEQIEVLDRQ
jgi:endonuclease YncB( thermonuclease family)